MEKLPSRTLVLGTKKFGDLWYRAHLRKLPSSGRGSERHLSFSSHLLEAFALGHSARPLMWTRQCAEAAIPGAGKGNSTEHGAGTAVSASGPQGPSPDHCNTTQQSQPSSAERVKILPQIRSVGSDCRLIQVSTQDHQHPMLARSKYLSFHVTSKD